MLRIVKRIEKECEFCEKPATHLLFKEDLLGWGVAFVCKKHLKILERLPVRRWKDIEWGDRMCAICGIEIVKRILEKMGEKEDESERTC